MRVDPMRSSAPAAELPSASCESSPKRSPRPVPTIDECDPVGVAAAKQLLRFRDKLETGGPFGAANIARSISLTAFSN
jgi:hypothetical protein